MHPYRSKLAPELQNAAERERRTPSVIVPSSEGVPAMTTLDQADWSEATSRLFDASERIASARSDRV
jgi:hypothetical protein